MVVGQAVSMAGSLVLVRVLTESLDPEQYGELALGLTVALLVNQVVMGGINNGIGRFFSIAAEQQALAAYLGAARRLMGYATLAVMAVGAILMVALWQAGFSKWMGLTLTVLVFSILSGCNATLNSIQNAARQRIVVAFHGGADAWLKILLAWGMIAWLGGTSTAVVLGFAVSTLVVTGSQLLFMRSQVPAESGSTDPAGAWLARIWAFSWPFATWGVFSWLQQSTNRWALEVFRGTQDVGLFAVLVQIGATPGSLAVGLLITFIGPILYQRAGNSTDRARSAGVDRMIWRLAGAGLLLTGTGFLLAWWLHPWVFKLMVAEKYRHVSHLLGWMVLSGGLLGVSQVLSQKVFCDLATRRMILPGVATPLVGLVATVYGAHAYGLQGVVAASLFYAVFNLTWIAAIARSSRPRVQA